MSSKPIQIRINGKTRTIRLRGVSVRAVERFRDYLYRLRDARRLNVAPDAVVTAWLGGLPDETYSKLVGLGLTAPRLDTPTAPTLKAWVERRIAARPDWEPGTRKDVKGSADLLFQFFGPNHRIDEITRFMVEEWIGWLRDTPYFGMKLRSRATIQRHVRNGKGLFSAAVAARFIDSNPFAGFKSGSVAAARPVYVTPEQAVSMIEACASVAWRTLIGLARYAGLRVPSESHILRWGDVDWERGRLNVRSPKTKRFPGHEARAVPMVPALRRLLEDGLHDAQDGQTCVVPLSNTSLQVRIGQITTRAGLGIIARPFVTLRQSCETEWAERFPQHAVSAWMGHSEQVSRKHYLMVPDELFDRAAKSADKALARATINSRQQPPVGVEGSDGEPGRRLAKPYKHRSKRSAPGSVDPDGDRMYDPPVLRDKPLSDKDL